MEKLPKYALMTRLMKELQEQGSWCGETHVQKATYFLQELFGLSLGLRYTLYWYGPFSFDLRDEINAMRVDGLVVLEPVTPGFGPKLKTTGQADYIQGLCQESLKKALPAIRFVAKTFAGCNVAQLERLATGLYVARKLGQNKTIDERAKELHRLKPHVPIELAVSAIQEMDLIMIKAQEG